MDGRRLYDWWSENTWALRGLYALTFLGREERFRRRSVDALDLSPGDSVLELGCGPGNSLGRLRAAVGPDGTVVGLDYSEGMVRRAQRRVARESWENVHVIHGDATSPPVAPDTFDAVYAAMSLTAMPDPAAAVRAAATALTPAGRFAALDARPFQGAFSVLNPVVVPVLARLTDWDHETDVPAAVDAAFDSSTVHSYQGGTIYVATAGDPSG
jgi:demethylmenaquinone methyltransferase/2-methoxy-6-polyprenyl-1,4-benzoquinol methylase